MSATVYAWLLIEPAAGAAGRHNGTAVIMLAADLAAGFYITLNSFNGEPVKRIPSATRIDEEKIIKNQMFFRSTMILCAYLTVAGILVSFRMTHLLLFLIPVVIFAVSYKCLKYFEFDVEDIEFPGISEYVIIGIFAMILTISETILDRWALGLGLAIVGAASFAAFFRNRYMHEYCRSIIVSIIAATVILLLSYIFFLGLNYTIVTEERLVPFTIIDMEETEESSSDYESYTVYVTNIEEGYFYEPVYIFKETYRSHNVGDTIELKERTSIFNVRALMEPSKTERGALVEMAELMGSDKAADITLLVIAIVLGLITVAVIMADLELEFFMLAAFLGFAALAIFTRSLGEPSWEWISFGVFAALAAFMLLYLIWLHLGDDEEDDEEYEGDEEDDSINTDKRGAGSENRRHKEKKNRTWLHQ